MNIHDVNDLQNMNLNLAGSYDLVNDIDCTGFAFLPVGVFTGKLYGHGYKIMNLTIADPAHGQIGLFTNTRFGAVIKNVKLTNINILGDNTVGALIGEAQEVTISDCSSDGIVSGESIIGGLIGSIHDGGTPLGVIIERCYSDCAVNLVAGIGNGWAGGLVGLAFVNVGAPSTIGIHNCYARGDVSCVPANIQIGGFIGWLGLGSVLTRCYSTGAPTSAGSLSVGGLCGKNTGIIDPDCFWDVNTSGMGASFGGTGEITAWMKTKANFVAAGYIFPNPWKIDPVYNNGYPNLDQTFPKTAISNTKKKLFAVGAI